MANKIQLLRSSTFGSRPATGTQLAGVPYVNFADKQFGVVDTGQVPQDLIGVPYFSTAANYTTGQVVNYLGTLYRANTTISAGAWNGTNWTPIGTVLSVGSTLGLTGGPITSSGNLSLDPTYFTGFLTGLTISYVNATNYSVSGGMASDATGFNVPTYLMRNYGGIQKTLSAWAVGGGNGSLDTGVIGSNTWYYVWLICRPDTGVVDVLLSGSLSSPVMPTNYTKKRRIGAIRTNASAQITQFSQTGDDFSWFTTPIDYSTTTLGTAPVAVTLLYVPPLEAPAVWHGYIYMNSGTAGAYVTIANVNGALATMVLVPTASSGVTQQANVQTNTNAQVTVVSNIAATTLNLYTYGWKDYRGRF
jgi:hypothetical protein